MKVYHGTSFDKFTEITINGLMPREDRATNWPDNPSMSDMVYLTTAYPFYFAHCASCEDGSKAVVIEIDVSHLPYQNFYPDEDFIFQAIPKKERPDLQLIRDHIEDYKRFFQKSIDHMGNFCYMGTIPRQAMTRAVSVDFKKRGELLMEVMDPTISILNYRLIGDKYIDLVAWFFGDKEELPAAKKHEMWKSLATTDECKVMMDKQIEFWKEQSKNREGIGIISL